jgi:taurine dioxygenase
MDFKVTPLGPGAAEITGFDGAQPLSDDLFAVVNRTFLEYPVLVFRNQTLSAKQFANFSRRFGQLESYEMPPGQAAKPPTAALRETKQRETPDQMLYLSPEDPDVLIMTNEIRTDTPPLAIIDNAEMWHADGSHKIEPYKAVLVHVLRNPAQGGDTEFCDMRALYDALPADVKKGLMGRCAIHNWSKSRNPQFANLLNKEARAEGERIAAMIPEMTQPLICAHPETGRPHLYLSPRFTIRIDDVPPEISDTILNNLFSLMEEPNFVYRHTWCEKDLMIWDNRCLNHRVRSYAVNDIRTRHRATVAGDSPMINYWAGDNEI